ncbi:bacteriophage P2 tail protein gpT [Yersinia enterocolitica]|uniref:phage tail tape measure protein n=3 Tax=Yersinia enterocolitica TaxID=630 RepID=UPI0005E367FD|nr:phage tail tape measure protein [Yersinia enterocolitica]CNC72528.1 bacteriophage P2 tail protein gpT [Yersinia enterocolitica]CNK10363.1 bacteriophage P2 tail protein gpT [Yersinia enterocolitica]CQI19090.1 bacteriophage P2 tail protein gpT [Yersinia enterocolitica]CQJ37336.1 bacteriophage P2 tail protein gpT [Yersinia enterocolitica]CQR03074.1 bacteriophage P2 tail protein gpT [Yersinia enterocolitica]
MASIKRCRDNEVNLQAVITDRPEQARDIGGSTAFSPTDVARTQDTLARSGYDADALLAATEPTVNLPLDQIQRLSDVMAKGFTSSNTNLLELGEAMKGAVKLVAAAGNGKLAEKQSKLKNADGTAQSIATIRMDNLDGDLKNLSSAWADLRIEVFEQQDSALRKLTKTATDWLMNVAVWAKKNPELVGTLTKMTGAALALVAGLGALGLIAWPVMAGFNLLLAGAGLLSTSFSLMGGTIATALTALTWPIVAVVAAIVAGGLLIRKYWEPISAFIAGVAEGFTAAMGPISAAFEPLKPVFNWFSDKVKLLSNGFADLIKPVKATQETLDVATNAGKLFGEGLAAALSLPMDALNTLRGGIDWVLEKLGVIDSKSTGLADNVPKDNPYAGGYSPSGGVLYGGYQPVTANTGTTIVDSSVTTNDIKVTIPPGMSRQDAERMMLDALARNERNKRARQRGLMEN